MGGRKRCSADFLVWVVAAELSTNRRPPWCSFASLKVFGSLCVVKWSVCVCVCVCGGRCCFTRVWFVGLTLSLVEISLSGSRGLSPGSSRSRQRRRGRCRSRGMVVVWWLWSLVWMWWGSRQSPAALLDTILLHTPRCYRGAPISCEGRPVQTCVLVWMCCGCAVGVLVLVAVLVIVRALANVWSCGPEKARGSDPSPPLLVKKQQLVTCARATRKRGVQEGEAVREGRKSGWGGWSWAAGRAHRSLRRGDWYSRRWCCEVLNPSAGRMECARAVPVQDGGERRRKWTMTGGAQKMLRGMRIEGSDERRRGSARRRKKVSIGKARIGVVVGPPPRGRRERAQSQGGLRRAPFVPRDIVLESSGEMACMRKACVWRIRCGGRSRSVLAVSCRR